MHNTEGSRNRERGPSLGVRTGTFHEEKGASWRIHTAIQGLTVACLSSTQHGTTLLMVAAYTGHIDCVRELVLQGADINLQREVGWLLHLSKNDPAARKSSELVRKMSKITFLL